MRDPVCPICGRECDTFVISDKTYEIVGCESCTTNADAYEYMSEVDYEEEEYLFNMKEER